ncbi:MAG: hypothetical protein V3T23_03035 [Nitrososphaerales archaeon]
MRCKTTWSSEHERLEPGDQVNIEKVRIQYCPACAEGFAAESERPTYHRPGKRIK